MQPAPACRAFAALAGSRRAPSRCRPAPGVRAGSSRTPRRGFVPEGHEARVHRLAQRSRPRELTPDAVVRPVGHVRRKVKPDRFAAAVRANQAAETRPSRWPPRARACRREYRRIPARTGGRGSGRSRWTPDILWPCGHRPAGCDRRWCAASHGDRLREPRIRIRSTSASSRGEGGRGGSV